uniref:Uncharacterized protein n=1 Tax=Arundo donax TaxID=35708 RepID=A0A0A9GVW6_ARUDO
MQREQIKEIRFPFCHFNAWVV